MKEVVLNTSKEYLFSVGANRSLSLFIELSYVLIWKAWKSISPGASAEIVRVVHTRLQVVLNASLGGNTSGMVQYKELTLIQFIVKKSSLQSQFISTHIDLNQVSLLYMTISSHDIMKLSHFSRLPIALKCICSISASTVTTGDILEAQLQVMVKD